MSWWLFTPRIVNAILLAGGRRAGGADLPPRRAAHRAADRAGHPARLGVRLRARPASTARSSASPSRAPSRRSWRSWWTTAVSMSIRDVNPDGTPDLAPAQRRSPSAATDAGRRLRDRPAAHAARSRHRPARAARTRRCSASWPPSTPSASTPSTATPAPSAPPPAPRAPPTPRPHKARRQRQGRQDRPEEQAGPDPHRPQVVEAIRNLKPEGKSTQVIPSLLTVLDDLQGQRLAGVVLITDARETPDRRPGRAGRQAAQLPGQDLPGARRLRPGRRPTSSWFRSASRTAPSTATSSRPRCRSAAPATSRARPCASN